MGTIFCAVADRPFLDYLYATYRDDRGKLPGFEGDTPNPAHIKSNAATTPAFHPPLPPPVPRLSELHQNCHIRHAATVARSENPQVRQTINSANHASKSRQLLEEEETRLRATDTHPMQQRLENTDRFQICNKGNNGERDRATFPCARTRIC